MNVIFLDVDGVLNSINNLIEQHNKTLKSYSGYYYPYDDKCLNNLAKLIIQTNSKIIITSSWRKNT